MIKADLITGFLGSGKTSFITEYATLLSKMGRRVAIIVNDHGAINVDRLILTERLKDICPVEMVIGGDADCLRRRMKTKLISLAMEKYEQVLIEPSGIFDADDFLDLMFDEALDRWYRAGSIISVVDGEMTGTLGKNARYVLAAQLSKSGAVVLGRNGGKSGAEILAYLNACLLEFKCDRRLTELLVWNKGGLSEEAALKADKALYVSGNIEKQSVTEDGSFEDLFFFESGIDADTVSERLKKLFDDKSLGMIYRVKGYIKKENGWLEVNAGRDSICVETTNIGQEVFIVIGESLDKEKIARYFTREKES